MSTALATQNQAIIQSLVINGDLSKLDVNQKVVYYQQYCERLGLDPFTQPFKILKLNGKETLYCDRSGAQQLNKIHKVSHEIKAREVVNDCYVVTAKASAGDRSEESIGAVPIAGLKGEALCNAYMKAETKAKRRSTLDLLGLGILDESETDSIPGAQTIQPPLPGTAERPTIKLLPALTDAQLKAVIYRLKRGEADLFDKTLAAFSLTESQLSNLNSAKDGK